MNIEPDRRSVLLGSLATAIAAMIWKPPAALASVAKVADTDWTCPDYEVILKHLREAYANSFGSFPAEFSVEDELLQIFARNIYDTNVFAQEMFRQFQPGTSTGQRLNSIGASYGVKRNSLEPDSTYRKRVLAAIPPSEYE